MKIVTLVSVIAILLFDALGTKSSVGGPLTLVLIFFLATLAVGIYDAWSNKRGVGGFIVSIVCAVFGGMLVVIFSGLAVEEILPLLQLDGSLASSRHPMRYVVSVGLMLLTLLGSWGALWIVNRARGG